MATVGQVSVSHRLLNVLARMNKSRRRRDNVMVQYGISFVFKPINARRDCSGFSEKTYSVLYPKDYINLRIFEERKHELVV